MAEVPVRAGRFISRKGWIIVGADDFQVRIYNYNTGEKVTQFEAHPDYIRSIAVHPSLPYVLTASDDMTVKMWNWDQNWKCQQIFEGHQHFVMSVTFNPKDTNTFATACLDRTVKVWNIGSSQPNFTLLAHETKGVNYVEYYPGADKPYLISCSDDRLVKVWDYQTKACVATLEGHRANVSYAIFHPQLPLIISGSEDGSVRVWNSATYKLEQTLEYGLERAWCCAFLKGSSLLALGFDAGHVILRLGSDKPAASMDPSGRIIVAKNSDIYTCHVRPGAADGTSDGSELSLTLKDLGAVEVFPSSLSHSPNGRFVAVAGDGEYTIYTALAWRSKTYGNALDFVWGADSSDFATRESESSISVFRNFKQRDLSIQPGYAALQIFGGTLLGVRSEGVVSFFDWESGLLVRRVDVDAEHVAWSESGELLVIATSESVYVLNFDRSAFDSAVESGDHDVDEGVEACFDVLYEAPEQIASGVWIGDAFLYSSPAGRVNYIIGGVVSNVAQADKPVFLLRYMARDNRVYAVDRSLNIVSFTVPLPVLEYQTVVLRGDLELAASLLDNVALSDRPKLARFLEKQDLTDVALQVTTDQDHRFELALQTGNLALAREIVSSLTHNEHKWRSLADAALASWNVSLALEAFEKGKDLESLLLVLTSTNNVVGLKQLAESAVLEAKYNIAFAALWAAADVDGCLDVLSKAGRPSEAAIMALTYNKGDQIDGLVEQWKSQLELSGKKDLGGRLCTPKETPEMFAALGSDDLIDVE